MKNQLLKIFTVWLLGFSLSYGGNPSMVLADCPEVLDCISGSVSISETLPFADLIILEVSSCGGVPRYQMNYKFEATSTDVVIDLQWTDVNGLLKLGLVSGCLPYGSCVEYQTCEFDVNSITIESTDLIVGHEYVVFVDGCSNSGVDFDLEITPGEDSDLLIYEDLKIDYQDCQHTSSEPDAFCDGAELKWEFIYNEIVSEEYFNQREATYHLTLDGPESRDFIVDQVNDFNFSVDKTGEYILCFNTVEFECKNYDIEICKSFTIFNNDKEYGTYEVCQHDLEEGNWVPDSDWLSESITEEGEYSVLSHVECDCPVLQTIDVVQINEPMEEVEIVLCPDDYPYVYFDEFEFDYSQFDIEEELYIHEGSIVKDYDNERCDSLVHLILVNEKPEDRCSSCHLPFSLEKSKIVACIPFDNATIDVSGRRTIVRENGVNYDDNGSTTNDLWEALFDGNEDYVMIPHISDLNTSVFSINFQFNKDERFENGNRETLASKGDIGKENIRYSIDLQKVNESKFDLLGTFYTESGVVEVNIPDLRNYIWYDIAYVVEPDSISLYLDGYIHTTVPVSENLKGNAEDFYLGTMLNNETRTQFYNGRLDNFKYWKQKLSGQDVLFLHFPGKEFEVDQSYFLACCEEIEFGDVIINKDNPIDSIVIPNASPTGYDSVYILNYIQNDGSPQVNASLAPEDILVQYQQECEEFCQATATWNVDASELFSDNCNNMIIEQSHISPVVLDENISFVEVTYKATDDCGQSTTHSFALELECLPSQVEEIPIENAFMTNVNGSCIDVETNTICKFSDVLFIPGYVNGTDTDVQAYSETSGFSVIMSINDVAQTYTFDQVQAGISFPELKEEGTYQICLESVSNLCETIANSYCETIHIGGSIDIDHGIIETCRDNVASALPGDISPQLESLVLSNPIETKISISASDDCGCEMTESIQLKLNDDITENVEAVICEGENIDGNTETGVFTSMFTASNGCDSIVILDLTVEPNFLVEEFQEICDGEEYEGHTEAGTYVKELVTTSGCDSIITLSLNVLPKSYSEIFVEICPDSTYMGYNETGTYLIEDINILGCDSITTLNLELLDANDPACIVSSIHDIADEKISIYPNPVSDILNVISESSNVKINAASIYNIDGKLMLRNTKNLSIDVSSLASGVYILKVEDMSSNSLIKVFVKN